MGTAQTIPEWRAAADEIWAIVRENTQGLKDLRESQEAAERQIMATIKATNEQIKATIKETNEQIKEVSALVDRVTQNVGGLNRSIGELIEILIAARLWEKFAGYPYRLERAYRRVPVYDEQNHLKTDIDILLSDTEWCMAVEVKREADDKDVDHHLGRIDLIRRYPPPEVAGKRLLGAIAGGVVPPDTVAYAHKAGFFVLELAGESVVLLNTPQDFAPGEW
jgi:hypothetical protein